MSVQLYECKRELGIIWKARPKSQIRVHSGPISMNSRLMMAEFPLRRGYRADEPSGPLLLHTSRSSCRGRCCQPLPSRPPVWRFLVDRHHCLSNILPGSSEMAQDPQTGCTNVLAIWESYVAW